MAEGRIHSGQILGTLLSQTANEEFFATRHGRRLDIFEADTRTNSREWSGQKCGGTFGVLLPCAGILSCIYCEPHNACTLLLLSRHHHLK